MNRQIQLRGERDWAGDDLIALQAEPLKAIDAIFARYPTCIVSGCGVSPNGPRFDVAPGYVSLKGTDHEANQTSMVVPFEGVRDTVLPVYLTLGCEVQTDMYGDGEMKPIAYRYKALSSATTPNSPYLEVSEVVMNSFADVLHDSSPRFMTDSEHQKLKDIETGANKYTHPNTPTTRHITDDQLAKLGKTNQIAGACSGFDDSFSVTVLEGAFSVAEIDVSDFVGRYRVTHNLGTKKYLVDAVYEGNIANSGINAAPWVAPLVVRENDYFDIGFIGSSREGSTISSIMFYRSNFSFKITVF